MISNLRPPFKVTFEEKNVKAHIFGFKIISLIFILVSVVFLSFIGSENAFSVDGVAPKPRLPPNVSGEILVKFKHGVSDARKNQIHTQLATELIKNINEIGWHHVRSKRGESTEILLERYRSNPDVEYAEPNILYQLHVTPEAEK